MKILTLNFFLRILLQKTSKIVQCSNSFATLHYRASKTSNVPDAVAPARWCLYRLPQLCRTAASTSAASEAVAACCLLLSGSSGTPAVPENRGYRTSAHGLHGLSTGCRTVRWAWRSCRRPLRLLLLRASFYITIQLARFSRIAREPFDRYQKKGQEKRCFCK